MPRRTGFGDVESGDSPTSVESTNRYELKHEDTAYQSRMKREKQLNDFKLRNLDALYGKQRENEKKIYELSRRDAETLNDEMQDLEDHYYELKRKKVISASEAEEKIQRASLLKLEELRLKSIQEAHDFEMDLAQRTIKLRIGQNQQEYNSKRKLLTDLKNQEKDLDDQINKAKTKEEKKALKEQKKNLQASIKDAKKGMEKSGLHNVMDQLGFTKEARKDQQDIMDEASTKYEGMAARLEANPYDVEAQIFTHLEESLNKLVENLSNVIDPLIETYTEYQSSIDARLQGSGQSWAGGNFGFGGISNTLMNAVGNNPYVSLTTLMENVSAAVEQGIAYNIEQRAFLATVSEDIATTFDAFNNNLLRIIRLQQNDTTAARLGLEASLTELFNSYFSDTSYLSDAADSVSSALTEAISQMGAEEGVEFEYVVQKWLGSLYSVGFSDSSVSAIADALGMLGSGDVSGLSGSSMQNLIVMAASRAGLSYADLLTGGLTASNTNQLLQAMVEYLQEIAESDNLVVKSQYAEVFGLTTSDLTAAENLGSTVSSLASEMESYSDTISELYYQMNQLPSRLSVGEMASNLMNNVLYSTAAGIASNPITYALWEITDLIESASGGINIPSIYTMFGGFDLNTTATNLMRLGVVGVSALGNIGTIINGIASTVYPANMLSTLGITSDSSSNAITRGSGLSRSSSSLGQSSYSSYVGNTAGSDYSDSVIAQAETSAQSTLDVKTAESTDKTITDIHEYMLEVMDPKLTSMVQMLGVMSGTKVSSGTTWGNFEDSNGAAYNATSVTISNIGETSTTGTNLTYMKSIDANLATLLTLLQNGELNVNANITNDTLSVKVDNYGLTSSRGGLWS